MLQRAHGCEHDLLAAQERYRSRRRAQFRQRHVELRKRFVAATKKLKAGDPRKRDTFLGPLIDEASAKRLETWIGEARRAGAKLLCGGSRDANRLEATVLENVPRDAKLNALEAFGPVTVLASFDDFEDAIARVNDADYGLQAGVFTDSLAHATRAWDALEVGGVVINDVPSFRVDNMWLRATSTVLAITGTSWKKLSPMAGCRPSRSSCSRR